MGTPSTRSVRVVLLVVLALGTGAVFSSALPGAFIWDDRTLIENNRHVQQLSLGRAFTQNFLGSSEGTQKLANLYYRPLVTLSFMIDHALYGKQPWGFHLTNVLLHILATLLVFFVALRLLRGGPGQAGSQPPAGVKLAAWAVAALFAIHPSRVEAVSWISGRTDVMMAVFALASMLLFWCALDPEGTRTRRPRAALAGAWATYVAALLCKETAIALALVVPALDWLVLRREETPQRLRIFWANARWCHLPLSVSTAAFVLFRLWYQGRALGPSSYAGMSVFDRLLILLETVGHYVILAVAPYNPSMQVGAYYTSHNANWGLVALGAAALVGLAAVLALAVRRSPVAAFALVLGAAFFVPASNIIPLSIHTLAADRFLYMPLLGAMLLLGMGLTRVARRRRAGRVMLFLVGLVALSWATMSNLRSRDFASPMQFWSAELSTNPHSPLVQEKLATTLMERRRYRQAEDWYQRSLRSLIRLGQPPERVVERLLKVLDSHMLHTSDHDTRALEQMLPLLARLGARAGSPGPGAGAVKIQLHAETIKLDFARPAMRAALAQQHSMLRSMEGNIHSRLGHDRRAVVALRAAVKGRPNSVAMKMNLALALTRAQDLAGARKVLARVRRSRPDAPEVESMERMLGEVQKKLDELQKLGYRRDAGPGDDVKLHWLLARMYKATGASHRACHHLSRVITKTPTDRKAWAVLATELATHGDGAAALAVVQRARSYFGDEPGLRRLEQRIRSIKDKRPRPPR